MTRQDWTTRCSGCGDTTSTDRRGPSRSLSAGRCRCERQYSEPRGLRSNTGLLPQPHGSPTPEPGGRSAAGRTVWLAVRPRGLPDVTSGTARLTRSQRTSNVRPKANVGSWRRAKCRLRARKRPVKLKSRADTSARTECQLFGQARRSRPGALPTTSAQLSGRLLVRVEEGEERAPPSLLGSASVAVAVGGVVCT